MKELIDDRLSLIESNEHRSVPELNRPMMGRYRALNLCGRGGMAAVYRARDLETSEIVAAKLMPVPEDWGRLQREVSTLRLIRHPNVVRFVDFRMDEHNALIVMEYLEGMTVSHLLAREGPMPWPLALRLAREVLEGLAPLHSAGLIHRDIKPSNLMIISTNRMRIKILDFGVVKPVQRSARRITQTGIVVGTPCYMPPEQCSGLQLTPAVDIYALGVVLWQALTGSVPHRGIIFVPEWPPKTTLDIPVGVRDFITTMVSSVPSRRYSDALSCLAALQQLNDRGPHSRTRANDDTVELKVRR